MSFLSVKAIVDAGKFDSLIGQPEDLWLEVKQKPGYDFTTPVGRYELAKDVTALANSEGGFILVGFTTDKHLDQNIETLAAIEPCTPQEFNAGQYIGIINEHTHPKIDGLAARWGPTADPNLGIGVVEVPPQSPEKKYFLTTKVVDEGVPLTQIFFGIARRVESSNDSLSAKDIYKMMQQGKSPVAESLNRLEDKLNTLLQNSTNPANAETPASKAEARINSLLDE